MSAIATLAPASTISRAVSAPIPRAAPEISATLPSSRFIFPLPSFKQRQKNALSQRIRKDREGDMLDAKREDPWRPQSQADYWLGAARPFSSASFAVKRAF